MCCRRWWCYIFQISCSKATVVYLGSLCATNWFSGLANWPTFPHHSSFAPVQSSLADSDATPAPLNIANPRQTESCPVLPSDCEGQLLVLSSFIDVSNCVFTSLWKMAIGWWIDIMVKLLVNFTFIYENSVCLLYTNIYNLIWIGIKFKKLILNIIVLN